MFYREKNCNKCWPCCMGFDALAVAQACSANAAGDCRLHSTAMKKRTCQGIGQSSQHKLNAAKATARQETAWDKVSPKVWHTLEWLNQGADFAWFIASRAILHCVDSTVQILPSIIADGLTCVAHPGKWIRSFSFMAAAAAAALLQ